MEFIGTHHATDLVTVRVPVQGRHAGPEQGDVEHQLGAIELQKLGVMGDLKVLPYIIGDRTSDVTLKIRIIRHPTLRVRVEIELVGLFLSVAAALPGKHRTPVPGVFGGRPSSVQPPVAVAQNGPGNLGRRKLKNGKMNNSSKKI